MNIVNKLTLRNLQQNRRRTLVTIIGVIISVAMVTAVATLGVSFMDLLQRQTIAKDGEWHVLYKNVNQEQLQAIKNDEETKTLIVSRDRGYAFLAGNQNRLYKPYLFIKEYDSQGFEQFPIELIKGRLPQANNEVVISEEIAESAKVKLAIGDQLVLDIGQRFMTAGDSQPLNQQTPLQTKDGEVTETLNNTSTHNYTVVGIIARPTWEPAWAPGYNVISYVDASILGTNDTVDAAVVLKQVKRSLYNHAQDLARQNNILTVEYNNELLRFYGVTDIDNLHQTLYSLIAIIMAIIVVGSAALIYNAFAISVSERSRHLGMLSSVGATRKQKRNSVFFEGAVIVLISIPLGILCGLGGLAITFWFINPMIKGMLGASGVSEAFRVVITPLSILGACVISILTIFISTYWPAKKASNISAIDAIRQTTDIKLNHKAVRTYGLIRRIFGFEAEIGLKNLKRNKRRYQATVFSLVISIVLFLTVAYFTDNLQKSVELSQDGVNFDIQVMLPGENAAQDEHLIQAITSLSDVTEYSVLKELTANAWIDEEFIPKELQEIYNGTIKDEKYPYYIDIVALDEKSLKDYAQEIGADYNQLRNADKLSGIVIDTTSYQDYEARKFIETKAINAKVGQSIELYQTDQETQKETFLNQLQIAALTDKAPMGVFPAGPGGLTVIVSEQVMSELDGNMRIDETRSRLLLKSSDPLATQHQIEDMQESRIGIYNVHQVRQQEEQIMLLMSVFTYGFIVLITAISMANIFNTISTSIALRKREFAMLKSVGMTPKGFNKMLNYESIFYGIKSLVYGLPLSIIVMYLIYRSLGYTFSYGFVLPWASIGYVVIAVFVIVGAAMLYSSSKVKKENIVDALKQENI
ncbi:MAG: ABC transporter permease [Syntrophomonadaceae bacterium]|jgi:putative ABC transport system permease protein